MLTTDRLRELFHYNPCTGEFTRKKWISSRAKMGDIAGYLNHQGYRCITIDYKTYYAHRLAWLYMTGEWPSAEIDHMNLVKSDNRWCNLRAATHAQNVINRPAKSNSTSGTKGVHWRDDAKKWRALIKVDGKNRHLGYFNTLEAAAAAYANATHHFNRQFARTE